MSIEFTQLAQKAGEALRDLIEESADELKKAVENLEEESDSDKSVVLPLSFSVKVDTETCEAVFNLSWSVRHKRTIEATIRDDGQYTFKFVKGGNEDDPE